MFEPMKDAAVGDIVGEVTSNLRSSGFRMGEPIRLRRMSCAEYIGA